MVPKLGYFFILADMCLQLSLNFFWRHMSYCDRSEIENKYSYSRTKQYHLIYIRNFFFNIENKQKERKKNEVA